METRSQCILGGAVIYLVLWTYSSIICIYNDEDVHIFIWPITPFLLIYRVLMRIIRAPFHFFSLGPKEIVTGILGTAVGIAAFAAVVIAAGFVVDSGVDIMFRLFYDFALIRVSVYIIGAFVCLLLIYAVAESCVDHLRDNFHLRNWRSEIAAAITAEALVKRYVSLRTRTNKLSWLREIRLRGSLRLTPDGESALRELAGSVGHDSR